MHNGETRPGGARDQPGTAGPGLAWEDTPWLAEWDGALRERQGLSKAMEMARQE